MLLFLGVDRHVCVWVGRIKKVYGEIHGVWKVEVVSQGKRNTIQIDREKVDSRL